MDATDLPDHVRENRRYWDGMAGEWVAAGERSWDAAEPRWGCWQLPEQELRLLPTDMAGMRAIELGCGTGYVSSWMAARGATVVGIDNSAEQLATARRLADRHGVTSITWVHGNAESVDEPDGSFDFAISEYGAAIWADPFVWIPEARRLLRAGGQLVVLGHTPWAMVCTPPNGSRTTWELQRPYFGLHRIDWTDADEDPGGVEFNLPISEWLSLFRRTGFEVVDHLELRVPDEVDDERFGMPPAWGREFPSEQVWKLVAR